MRWLGRAVDVLAVPVSSFGGFGPRLPARRTDSVHSDGSCDDSPGLVRLDLGAACAAHELRERVLKRPGLLIFYGRRNGSCALLR